MRVHGGVFMQLRVSCCNAARCKACVSFCERYQVRKECMHTHGQDTSLGELTCAYLSDDRSHATILVDRALLIESL